MIDYLNRFLVGQSYFVLELALDVVFDQLFRVAWLFLVGFVVRCSCLVLLFVAGFVAGFVVAQCLRCS